MRTIIDFVTQCDRWHRLFMMQLRRILLYLNISDLSALQALLLYQLGTQSLRVTQLAMGEVCLGSNPSYNLKKMIASGYLCTNHLSTDKRVLIITLSEKGLFLYEQLQSALEEYSDRVEAAGIDFKYLQEFLFYGKMLEHALVFPLDKMTVGFYKNMPKLLDNKENV